jgi:DNA-binding response OmpR family regulator
MTVIPIAGKESPSPSKLLIVDSLGITADSLAIIFSKEGYEVRREYAAETALKVAETWQPDVLISEIILSGMSGLDFAKKLTARYPDCSIILHSGQVSGVVVAEALSLNYLFFPKPMHPSVLIDRVHALLSSKRERTFSH